MNTTAPDFDVLLGSADVRPPSRDTGPARFDSLLHGLAIFEAYDAGDQQALVALFAGSSTGEAIASLLSAMDLLASGLSASTGHTAADLITALRRQTVAAVQQA